MLVSRFSWDSNSYPSNNVSWLLETELPLSDRVETPLFTIIMKKKDTFIYQKIHNNKEKKDYLAVILIWCL
jgi:hypothetical protein